ncbi:LSU ribosomal protein L29p (L35e) [Arcticibacter svalbardensis MN12-7]|uniref:Large ribosomal subunit protein uL29 n=2 Tax=Sphingobacteriaceae TaxID=84566 RepID=R9GN07_9SPHI|nr:LSU ribosomal protein L29p (L35e) [Arcticibacter svalbardensis MN12-7]
MQFTIKKEEKMKPSGIIELSTEEIVSRMSEERTNLTKLKFAHTVSAIENPSRISKVRKEIARLNTELTKRKAAAAAEKQSASETE